MTAKEQISFKRLKDSIQKCKIHLNRLHYALTQIEDFFPLTVENYTTLSDSKIGNIDQLVFRFTKLQDELGNNTFRFLLEYFQEDITGKPFRDILNILERLQIIDSADYWLLLRELMNDLAHEYPMMVDETIEKMNYLFQQLPQLELILLTIEQKTK
ncbi:MAG: toxin-antitoxin system antitoxin subunit [Bacteroidales bacterium]